MSDTLLHTTGTPAGDRPKRAKAARRARRSGRPSSAAPKRATFARVEPRRKRRGVRRAQQLESARRLAAPAGGGPTLSEIHSPDLASSQAQPDTAPKIPEAATNLAPASADVLGLPKWLCRLAREALVALPGRADADFYGYRLDGKPASFRQLVLAAREAGAPLPYPGVHPHVDAYHTGPSVALPKLEWQNRAAVRPDEARKGVLS